uniref:Uncharacterized protein n=1 Tax=Fagus sylvatica TaxID=28930 RepID=A0A2N9F3Z1_FAGSY
MEGAPNDGTSADPAMTPVERQMQVIATSIQDPCSRNLPTIRPDNQIDLARSSRDPDDKTAHLEKELWEMRKQMGDMKNSLKAKTAHNLDNLVHRADSPFILSIADFPLPSRFKVPLLENFDGTKDPFDYLEAFKTIMQLQAVPEELSRAFIDHFIGSQRRGRPPTHLLSVKQMEGESLRAFVHRFNEEAMKIDRPKEDVTVTTFMAGLRKGDFLYDLCKDPPETMSELMYEATKHMNAEDALEAMDNPPPKRRKDTEDRKPEPAKQKGSEIHRKPRSIQNDPSLRWPGKIRSDPNSRPKNLYCRFHRDHGHLTEDCIALKEQVETLIRQGKLQKYVNRPANTRPAKPPAQKEQTEHNRPGPVGEIRTIVGGPASGGTSRASRKAYARQLIQQMRLDKDKLRPMDAPLVGFTGDKVCPVGIVTLPITELDTIELEDGHPERTTKIGANLPPKMKESLVQFLKNNKDVFAWSHEDMPGIDPSIILHKLNVNPSLRPVKQKRRVFVPERNDAIMEEVDKLLTANFIREVFYPDWLANVVMIVMDESDQEKTSFITSRGLFCYKVMPFGLKNAGATYQQLMNRMFHDQIGRNVEVYNDDMLVKSKEEDGHLDDLRETFKTLRKYQMKLNPSKCAFGVYSGKFLGFMVSQRGIEANPDKIKAILRDAATKNYQRSPKTNWKNSCIEPQAFEELKRYLTEPPLLSPSKQGEELYLGAEERYPPMEKLAFALVTAARKLRPYFQAYMIVLLINYPLRKAMNKPDAAGRLIQWSIELSEFDIDYRPRTAIKAQALADFIAEFTSKDDEPTEDVEQTSRWTVNIDGSSTKDSGGIGVVLKSPEGDTIKQVVRLQYPTTNNEAEYEALLAGLKMAKVLGATELDVLSDSQLVVGQVNEDYEAKEGRMQRYLHLIRHQMKPIPRADDKIKIVQQSSLQTIEVNLVHTEVFLDDTNSLILTGRDTTKQPTRSQTIKGTRLTFSHVAGNIIQERLLPPLSQMPGTRRGQLRHERNTRRNLRQPLRCTSFTKEDRSGFREYLCRTTGSNSTIPDSGSSPKNLGIHNHYSSPGHPQANGQVEVTNRSLLKLIKTRLEGAKGLWPEELPSILWAYRTTVRIPTGETPFRMTFGSEAVVPVEIELTTLRTSAYDDQQNEEQLCLNLDLIDEVRETAEARMKRYQEKMARHYNSKVKPRQLSIGDLVLRKVTLATRNPSEGKLGPNWEGPYKVIEIRRPGTYHLEDMNGRRLPHPWNAEHLRKYYP